MEDKSMSDYIVKAIGYEGEVRAYAIRSTETVREAQRRHDTWATASAALGRTLTASAMIGTMLKDEGSRITVKIEGDGPIGHILVDAHANGKVRGYVANPHVHFDLNDKGKLDVSRAVGNGMLTVIKDLGLKEKFSGQVPLVSGEIGEDFTYYFATSEQTPSAVGVGVLVNPDHTVLASGGFILQIMPGAKDETITAIENHLKTIKPISTMVREGIDPEGILEELLGKGNLKILETVPVEFECTCSKERFGNALISLGAQELQEMIEEDGQAEAQCHFCNEKYLFTKEELENYKRLAEEQKQK